MNVYDRHWYQGPKASKAPDPNFTLIYCDTIRGNCGITLRDKLQKLQNRAARVLTFSNYDADATELFHRVE